MSQAQPPQNNPPNRPRRTASAAAPPATAAKKSNSPQPAQRDPIPVVVIDDQDQPSLGRLAFFIFLGTLLGSLIGAVADFGEALNTFETLGDVFNPPLTVHVAGSDTILGDDLGMAQRWEQAFEDATDLRVEINPTGSSAGVRLAAEGGPVQVLAMSERMSDTQYNTLQSAGISVDCAAPIGYDVIAFVTDINSKVGTLRIGQLTSVLRGETTNWSEFIGGRDQPITILARPIEDSGTTKHVMDLVARRDAFPPIANYVECDDNAQCLNLTLGTPGSLYWVSTSWMRTQPDRYLRLLPILQGDERPVDPLRDETFALEDYPSALARPLYMYVLRGPNTTPEERAAAEDFLVMVRGVTGQEILEEAAFSTYFDQATDIPIELPPGFEPDARGLRPLCIAGS